MREIVCHKYTSPYDIDLDALQEEHSSHLGLGGANRNMSVQINQIKLNQPGNGNLEAKEQIKAMMNKQDAFI